MEFRYNPHHGLSGRHRLTRLGDASPSELRYFCFVIKCISFAEVRFV